MVTVADCELAALVPDEEVLVHSKVPATLRLAVNGILMPPDTLMLTPVLVLDRVYIYSEPPKVKGVCDREGATLIQRADDTESVFHERMKAFRLKTAAVIEYYRSHGNRFAEVDGDQSVEAVTKSIRNTLLMLRHHPESSE